MKLVDKIKDTLKGSVLSDKGLEEFKKYVNTGELEDYLVDLRYTIANRTIPDDICWRRAGYGTSLTELEGYIYRILRDKDLKEIKYLEKHTGVNLLDVNGMVMNGRDINSEYYDKIYNLELITHGFIGDKVGSLGDYSVKLGIKIERKSYDMSRYIFRGVTILDFEGSECALEDVKKRVDSMNARPVLILAVEYIFNRDIDMRNDFPPVTVKIEPYSRYLEYVFLGR